MAATRTKAKPRPKEFRFHTESLLLRMTVEQRRVWEAAAQASYRRSLTEWIRRTLDEAAQPSTSTSSKKRKVA